MVYIDESNTSEIISVLRIIKSNIQYFQSKENAIIKVYGGFIRDNILKETYHDIDIYIENIRFSANSFYNSLKRVDKELCKMFKTCEIKVACSICTSREQYGNAHIELCRDDMTKLHIDISTRINNHRYEYFKLLCDYSVNNLIVDFIDTEERAFSEIELRIKDKYSVSLEETLKHIYDRQLVNMFNPENIFKFISLDYDWWNGQYSENEMEPILNKYYLYILKRQEKMINYGYIDDKEFSIQKIMENIKSLVTKNYTVPLVVNE